MDFYAMNKGKAGKQITCLSPNLFRKALKQ